MGTDINVYVEQRIRENREWVYVPVPETLLPDDRSYYLWAYLFTDMRASWPKPPLFDDRELPEDSSYLKLSDEDKPPCCMHTYAYLDELQNVDWDVSDEDGQPFKDCYFKSFVMIVLPRFLRLDYAYESRQKEELRNVRLIIGFDS